MSSKKKVVIIDYNLGNLFSVSQACEAVGINAVISSKKEDIDDADALILPGVGAFIEAMQNLHGLDLVETLKRNVVNGKPIFGVCLGLQLLFTRSEEFGSGDGLDLVNGVIKRFPSEFEGNKIRVPQVAWNKISAGNNNWSNSPLHDICENEFMYFVHSYFVDPAETDCVLTMTDYQGISYCSSILKGNIFATQFHPEKSGQKGIVIYKNWALINKLI